MQLKVPHHHKSDLSNLLAFILWLSFFIISVLVLRSFYASYSSQIPHPVSQSTLSTFPSRRNLNGSITITAATVDTRNWQLYDDPVYKFTIRYPTSWYLKKVGKDADDKPTIWLSRHGAIRANFSSRFIPEMNQSQNSTLSYRPDGGISFK